MRAVTFGFCAAVLVAGIAVAQPVMHSLEAEEAQQGVASDGTYAYAIDNSRIGKYDIKTGQRVAQWEGPSGLFPHMNACTLVDKRLLCAASNFPQVPMTSAIEIFDPVAMKHLTTISLGMGIGSLTWVDRKDGFWWAGFANYAGKAGEPGHDHRYTSVLKLDDQWRQLEGWTLPDAVLERMAEAARGNAAKLHVPLGAPASTSAVLDVARRFWCWTATDASDRVQPIVHCFSGSAAALDGLEVTRGDGAWLDALARLRPELDLLPEGALMTTWDDDPWATFAYSGLSARNHPGDEEIIRAPLGDVHFAGEHTAGEWSGLMEGALRSGLRTADEIHSRS